MGRFSAISAGGWHTCGLRETGEIECWGHFYDGATLEPSGRFSAVSAGDRHSCGLRETGEAECWGANDLGATDAPSEQFSAVSAGGHHSCGLRGTGEVECWGYDWGAGQTEALAGRFSAVSVGGHRSCGLRETGEIECWGYSWTYPIGAPAGRFVALSVGGLHICGLHETGEVECWGYTFDGQEQPPAGAQRSVDAGDVHTCAVSVDGVATCWMVYGDVADVPAWLRASGAAQTVGMGSGRIAARRLADGRTEFGWQPSYGSGRALPRQRYVPADAGVDRWRRSGVIEVDGVALGRIEARLRADGRIEFAFTPSGGERILPSSRYLPVDADVGRWLRSSVIALGK